MTKKHEYIWKNQSLLLFSIYTAIQDLIFWGHCYTPFSYLLLQKNYIFFYFTIFWMFWNFFRFFWRVFQITPLRRYVAPAAIAIFILDLETTKTSSPGLQPRLRPGRAYLMSWILGSLGHSKTMLLRCQGLQCFALQGFHRWDLLWEPWYIWWKMLNLASSLPLLSRMRKWETVWRRRTRNSS